jgi:porphobilinogen deaminase
VGSSAARSPCLHSEHRPPAQVVEIGGAGTTRVAGVNEQDIELADAGE